MRPLHRLLQPGGFVFFQRLEIVQPPQKEKVRNLLNDFERIGNPPGPEGIPDPIDLILDVTGYHCEIVRSGEPSLRGTRPTAGSGD